MKLDTAILALIGVTLILMGVSLLRTRSAFPPPKFIGMEEPIDWSDRIAYDKNGPIEEPFDYSGRDVYDQDGLMSPAIGRVLTPPSRP